MAKSNGPVPQHKQMAMGSMSQMPVPVSKTAAAMKKGGSVKGGRKC